MDRQNIEKRKRSEDDALVVEADMLRELARGEVYIRDHMREIFRHNDELERLITEKHPSTCESEIVARHRSLLDQIRAVRHACRSRTRMEKRVSAKALRATLM